MSLAEKDLDQARDECLQERLAKQTTEKGLVQAQTDRDREREARRMAERAQAVAEKAGSERDAAAERTKLELTDRVDQLQETVCDLEASLDRDALNYKTALADLASSHELRYRDAVDRADRLQAELNQTVAGLEARRREGDSAALELDKAKSQLKEVEARCEVATEQAKQAKSDLAASRTQLDEAVTASTATRIKLDFAMAKMNDEEKEHEATTKRAEQLSSCLLLSEAMRLELQEASNENVSGLSGQITELKVQLQEMERMYQVSAQRVTTLQAALKESEELCVKAAESIAEVESLKKQVHGVGEECKAAGQRADQLQRRLGLSEEQRLSAEARERQLLKQVEDLTKQKRNVEQHHVALSQQVAQLTKELQSQLALSAQELTQLKDNLRLSDELHRRVEAEAGLLRDKNTELVTRELSQAQLVEQLQESLNSAQQDHLDAKEAQLLAEEGHLRAAKQLEEALARLADARCHQDESAIMVERLEKEVATLTTERDEAVKARDDARVTEFFKTRELREELARIKGRERRQETAVRLVATELIVNTRTRFGVHRNLMGLSKLRPDRSDGWTYWKGLPDDAKNARLEHDMGLLNTGWLRIAMSLLKEAECIANYWHSVGSSSPLATVFVSLLTPDRLR